MLEGLRHRRAIVRAAILAGAGACGIAGLVLEHGLQASLVAAPVMSGLAVSGFLVELALAWRWRAETRRFLRGRWPSLVLAALLLVQVVLVPVLGPHLLEAGGPWWRPSSLTQLFLVVLQFYVVGALLANLPRLHRRFADLRVRPGLAFVLIFALAIVAGAGLLMLPRATPADVDLGPVDALFTATSAVCVTGLIVRDTAVEFTRFGQTVILALIQAGGLGIMSLSATLALLLGRGIGVRESGLMREVFQVPVLNEVGGLLRFIVGWTLVSEAVGAGLLYLQLGAVVPDASERMYVAVFHAVSAFCNAGFSTCGDSLRGWPVASGATGTVMGLLIAGGLGFTVVFELLRRLRAVRGRSPGARRPVLGLQTRTVLTWTAALLAVGAVGVAVLEWRGALAGMPWPERLAHAAFQSATARTAGFDTIPIGALAPGTLFLLMMLMFVGGGPGSTAGGVKITTMAVIMAELRAIAAGRRQVRLRNRELDDLVSHRATVVVTTGALVAALGVFLLLVCEPLPPLALAFEAVSAFGTVGLSTGITPQLSVAGKLVVIVLMFVGRLGVLTLAYALTRHARDASVRLPREQLMIG
jgi:trk system potassium uptake protein TrkH